MANPKISVIMLTYNRENMVSTAIESILKQSFQDFEFIIIDNGSTDKSGNIAEHYAQGDLRLKVIHRSCGNIGSGRNTGLDAAIGKYIAFIDDDDYAMPDFLEFLYELAEKSKADIAICGASGREFNEKFIMNAEDALVKLFWRKYYNVQLPTKLLHNKMFKNFRFSETAKYDDIELFPKILAGVNKAAYHGLAKYTFYRHENNNSAWTTNHKLLTKETLDEYMKVYRERTVWLSKMFPDMTEAWQYFEWSFMLSMIEKINRYRLCSCHENLEFMYKELKEHWNEFYNSKFILEFEKEWMRKSLQNIKD